jgi:U3 small nucleolar RNA-associated protein 19
MAPRSLPPPSKKRKVASVDDLQISEIATLEAQLTRAVQDGGSLNSLADLLALAQANPAPVQRTSKSIYALYRVFVTIISSGKLASGGDEDAKAARAWIWARFDAFADILCGLLQDTDKGLRVCLEIHYLFL